MGTLDKQQGGGGGRSRGAWAAVPPSGAGPLLLLVLLEERHQRGCLLRGQLVGPLDEGRGRGDRFQAQGVEVAVGAAGFAGRLQAQFVRVKGMFALFCSGLRSSVYPAR